MFVGMDVHKESIDVSLAEEGRDGEVRHYGVIAGDLEAVGKVVRALRTPNRRLRFVYEAGPCGFGIHRFLIAQGEDCVIVNPSSMPKRSGDRIKTDRRDGDALARLHRAGELTAIYIPTADDEALRDLVRAREDAVGLSTQAKHRLKAFLLRQGRRYPGRAGWTRPYRRWLADLSFPLAPQHIALQEYRDTIDETERRVERLTDQLRHLTPPWRWAPVVDALQALRGVSFVTAVGLVAESVTSDASAIRESSWRFLASCRQSTQAGPVSDGAGSPKPAIRTRGGCSPKRRGRIRACRGSDGRCCTGKKRCRRPSATSRGKRSSA